MHQAELLQSQFDALEEPKEEEGMVVTVDAEIEVDKLVKIITGILA